MATPEVVPVLTEGIALGECPTWSVVEDVLYWIDIDGRSLHRHDPSSGTNDVWALPGRPGSLALTATPGRLLVAVEHDLLWVDLTAGDEPRLAPMLNLEKGPDRVRLNDGRATPEGRFLVGSMWDDVNERRSEGSLYLVGPDGPATLETDIGVANGSAFDLERGRMYFADTFAQTVWMYDYDRATGSVTNRQLFLDYEPLPGFPDGACVDADGCYWSAAVGSGSLVRVTPEGAVDRRVELPVEMPSMPAFGGSDLSTLYVTAIASESGSPGGLFALDVGVAGRPEPTVDLLETALKPNG